MPVATIDPSEQTRHELTSLEGAYVVLRAMSYDTYLVRRDMLMRIQLAGKGGGDTGLGEMKMSNHKVALFDFKECVVEHNLEDSEGNPLDLTKPSTFKRLHPRIGNEISDLIAKMIEPLEDDNLGN